MTHTISRSAVIVVALLVAGGLVTGVVPAPADAQSEPLPASYYGNVEFAESGPAPVGTEITAIAGDQQDTITVSEEGVYGGEGTYDDKLVLQEPNTSTGTPVTFEVDAPGAEVQTAETDPSSVTWESEDVLQVDLTVTDTVPIQSIRLEVGDTGLNPGDTTTVSVIGEREDGTETDVTDQSDITSGDTDVATIDGATITAQSVSETSSVIIEANYQGLTGTTSIAVSPESGGEEEEPSGGGPGGPSGTEPGAGEDDAPPTVQEVRDTLNLIDPDTQTTTDIADADPDTPGVNVRPEGTESIRQINFNNEELTGSVDVTEYNNPPQQIRETIASSVADQIEEISLHTDNELDDGRTVQTEPSNINVITVSDITVTSDSDDEDEDRSATVEISVDRDRVDDPQNLVVVKEGYDFEEQTDRWGQLETTIQEVNEDEVTVQAEVPDFSLFAVVEIEPSEEQQQVAEDDGEEEPEPEDDGSPLTIILVIVALALVGGAAYYIGQQSSADDE